MPPLQVRVYNQDLDRGSSSLLGSNRCTGPPGCKGCSRCCSDEAGSPGGKPPGNSSETEEEEAAGGGAASLGKARWRHSVSDVFMNKEQVGRCYRVKIRV